LIIEVDGGQHNEHQEEDKQRTSWLEKEVYRVLRYWNNDVLENIDDVLLHITEFLRQKYHPHLALPSRERNELTI
jgi:very-short-patch-repair endonuclease